MKTMRLNPKKYYSPETQIVRLQYAESLMDEGWSLSESGTMGQGSAPARVAARKLYL